MAAQDYAEGLDFFPDDPFTEPNNKPQASDLFLGRIMGKVGTLMPKADLGSASETTRVPSGIPLGV